MNDDSGRRARRNERGIAVESTFVTAVGCETIDGAMRAMHL